MKRLNNTPRDNERNIDDYTVQSNNYYINNNNGINRDSNGVINSSRNGSNKVIIDRYGRSA